MSVPDALHRATAPEPPPLGEAPRLNTRSLREQVYDYLRAEMARGGLQPGGFLDLTDIARRLGISRTPLREALLHLEAQGFVSVFPRRGFRLNDLTLDDIRHFYEIIGALEASALRSVGRSLGPADFSRMRQLDADMADAVAARDFDRYYAANLAFHDVYLARSDNARLVAQVRLLKQRLYDWPRRRSMVQAWEQHSMVEHEDFLRLLERGDIDEAAAHLQRVHWSFAVQEPFIHAYYFAAGPGAP
ncbi:MAG TPA: GntR family transcriptional regulator [Vicinamibacterales bacterium]|nr:GntR family transcriptional regulator [Vicinamibacterales bacterium]HPW21853.1 GntR family transcriptional regulator [Vicinamibacterales bacterium]